MITARVSRATLALCWSVWDDQLRSSTKWHLKNIGVSARILEDCDRFWETPNVGGCLHSDMNHPSSFDMPIFVRSRMFVLVLEGQVRDCVPSEHSLLGLYALGR